MKSLSNFKISENLKYHLDNGLSLSECIFRYGSESHIELIEEVRDLYQNGKILLEGRDKVIAELKTGKPAIYKGKKVKLHLPDYDNTAGKKFRVYIETDKIDEETGYPVAKILRFGDPERTVKNHDKQAADSFQARHRCDTKTDINTAGFWSCNLHIFWEHLNLKSSYPW